LDRWAEKSAQNLIDSIEQSKQVPFERVLFALGIRFVGETVAKKLALVLHNIDAIKQKSVVELMLVDEIGERIAQSLVSYFANDSNLEILSRLKQVGLRFEIDEQILANKSDKLSGLSIVISGTFEKHSRDELKDLIEQNGGKNVGSISAKTDFVLAGENMGPAKLEKANKLGIKIISEEDFLEMIN
jgi:DNA ligase (NAD+)